MMTVRSFPARVVRQEWAPLAVTALVDPVGETTDAVGTAADDTAYEVAPPALYVYKQQDEDGTHTGLVCEVTVQAFMDGRVRGHEAVQPARVDALVRHHAATSGPPALVTLLHHAGPAFTHLLETTLDTAPILDFPGPDGVRQTVWRVPHGAATTAVTDELRRADHYIADGHHRVAAALEEWRLSGKPPEAGVLCVIHPMEDLRVSAFHRLVTGPVEATELLERLRPGFRVSPVDRAPDPGPRSFGLYVGGSWYDVTYDRQDDDPDRLDIVVLEDRLLARAGEPGPPYDLQIAPTGTSVDDLARERDADGGALFTLAPPALAVLTSLADAGEVMPPKTTYFAPKPCTGIFLRLSP